MSKNKFTFPICLFATLLASCSPISSSASSFEQSSASSSECDMWCDVSEGGGSSTSSYVPPVVDMEEDQSEGYPLEQVSLEDGSMAYEVFVRTFYDSNGDGIGDFNGLKQKLPYLASLGINTLWLMPINPSPTYHGYDVKDYYAVNPQFGTMDDFKNLLSDAHDLGMNIIIDMVLNHSSKQHPWLDESYTDWNYEIDGEDSKADWYVWSKNPRGSYHQYKKGYYEGRFDSSMPDLNFDSPSLRKEIENIIKFWASDIGVDGFRLDAVKYYYYEVTSQNVEVLSWFKEVACRYNPDFYMVGECWASSEVVEGYAKSTCDSFFNFASSLEGVGAPSILGQVRRTIKSSSFAEIIELREANIKEKNPNGYYSYFLSNHDMDRAGSGITKEYEAKMAASLYGLLPGTSYMYYGEEIELKGRRGSNDHSDAKRRLPMIWSSSDKTGECDFPESNRQDLNNTVQVTLGVEEQEANPFSLLNHYKKVANVRNKYPLMRHGVFKNRCADLLSEDTHVLAYEISLDDESIVIIHNFNDYNVEVDVSKFGTHIDSAINTGHMIPTIQSGLLKLGKYSTVVIK